MSTPIGLPVLEAQVKREIDFLVDPGASWVQPRTHASGKHVHDVAIVGGGQSGLGAAFALRRDGVTNVVVLDENAEGKEGPWITYARMITLRTPKHLTGIEAGLPSLTFRAWYEAQHGHEAWDGLEKIPRGDWMAYLCWIRSVLALPVRNTSRVTAITRGPDGLLHLAINGEPDVILARTVVLATGIQGGGEWHVPRFIAEALPRHLYGHTSEDIDFAKLAGKRIGILGAGASSFDNAQHALSLGVSEAHVFVRRNQLPRVNAIRHMERVGLTKRYALLPDEEKYAAIDYFLRLAMPPTNDTYQRAASYPGFRLHLGAPWKSIRQAGNEAIVTTPHGEQAFDFLVVSTGIINDVSLRPELAAFLPDISLWRDHAAQAERRNADVDAMPYLGPGFQLTGKDEAASQRVAGLFMFNYSALASLGMSASALSGLRYALPRLVEGVATHLFLGDKTAILDSYYAYNDEEFLGHRS